MVASRNHQTQQHRQHRETTLRTSPASSQASCHHLVCFTQYLRVYLCQVWSLFLVKNNIYDKPVCYTNRLQTNEQRQLVLEPWHNLMAIHNGMNTNMRVNINVKMHTNKNLSTNVNLKFINIHRYLQGSTLFTAKMLFFCFNMPQAPEEHRMQKSEGDGGMNRNVMQVNADVAEMQDNGWLP